MNLLTSYNGLSEEDIRAMSHEELIQAVLRMFARNIERAGEYEDYSNVLIPDHLADAFRGRT
jgi:D-ribose pyranose/furanose isomerase RbsD